MKTLLIVWFTIALSLLAVAALGQNTLEEEDEPGIERPVQLTFIAPLGTNGLECGKVTNKLSINVLGGYSGGLKGAEFGGFANVIKGEMVGAQFAGFSNTVINGAKGAQFAGFSNVVRTSMHGAQFAGFGNVVTDGLHGAQFAGFGNMARNVGKAFQAAGFGNMATGDMVGGQAAGFGNSHNGSLQGAQIAGFANVNLGDVKGGQIAGFANVARDVDGVQISGFINVARNVKGLQIGFINIADSMDGVPIGIFNFVRKGYHALEVSGNETMYANLSAKSGTERFYNILTTGVRPGPNGMIWSYGYGFGTLFQLNEQFDMNIDATASHLNDGEWFTSDLNLLNKLQINLAWDVSEQVQLYGGASFNVHVSDRENGERELIGSEAIPWSIYDNNGPATLVRMYPGFQLGMRL